MRLSGTQYQCVAGETFDSVALAVYGDERHSCDLLCANPGLSLIPVFTGGELLDLPVIDAPEADGRMTATAPWKRG